MRKQRFIYNNDGTFLLSNSLHDRRRLTVPDVHAYVDQVADTGVTSFFICSGSSMPYYTSRHERTIGCLEPGTPPSDGAHPHAGDNCELYGTHTAALGEDGTDIVAQCVLRAHARGMEAGISMRMNDLHFTDPSICFPLGQGDFWLEHAEYRLGSAAAPGWHTEGAHDYSHVAVRQYKLRLFEEICANFDADAVELDFMRFPIYFPDGQGPQCTPLMTEFVRQARQIANAAAQQRGRPLELGIRLLVEMKRAHHLGFDPVTYTQEQLIDFITLTPFLHDLPTVPVTAFRNELGDEHVPIYAGLMSNTRCGPVSHGGFRARAANCYRNGADGLCLFNFFFTREEPPQGKVGTGPCRALLHELAGPEPLEHRNKLYAAGIRYGYPGVDPDPTLPAELTSGTELFLEVGLAETTPPAQTPLLFVGTRGADDLECEWNGRSLDRMDGLAFASEYGAGRALEQSAGMVGFALRGSDLRPGGNVLRLVTAGGGELISVELAVPHGSVEECGYF
jgi:hypothetical protein